MVTNLPRDACTGRVLHLTRPASVSMLEHVIGGQRAWDRLSLSPDEWRFSLDDRMHAEIATAVTAMRQAPLPLLLREPNAFELSACEQLMATVKQRLVSGAGMVILDGLAMNEMSTEEATVVFWLLGQFLARPVATRWDGTMLYDVTDTGKKFGYGTRGSATNVELPFHTDNAFGVALPDYVGLLCIHHATVGGITRCASLYRVHNELRLHHSPLLERLYQPVYYDRQGEHAPDAPGVLSAPLFQWDGKRLSARFTPNLISRGYDLVGESMDDALTEALAAIQDIVNRDHLSIETQLTRGQMQFLDNHWCAHYRAAYTDELSRKRHLVRMWLRHAGRRSYDG